MPWLNNALRNNRHGQVTNEGQGQFSAEHRRRKEIAYWAPLPIQFDLLRVSVAGTLTGLDIPAPRNLKLTPYVLGELRQRGTGSANTHALGDFGGDLKYSLTPSLTLDATYNTDFAQVEVDEQQINLDAYQILAPNETQPLKLSSRMFDVLN